MTPERFERQIATLARRGFRGVTFADAASGRAGGQTVAITFDDAFRSVLELAAPILARHRMPATVFVPTSFPSRSEPMSWPGIDRWFDTEHENELLPLSWEELGDLRERGWEIGSHTHTHPRLTELGDEELRGELRTSLAACADSVGTACRTLAYPYGDHDQRVIEATRAAGYAAAAALPSPWAPPQDPLSYPRIGIYHRDSLGRFALKVSPLVRRLRAGNARVSSTGASAA